MRHGHFKVTLFYSVMKYFCRLLDFVILGTIALFIKHALECGSVKGLRNRENVRDEAFVRECSQGERSRETFAKGDGGYNVREGMFAYTRQLSGPPQIMPFCTPRFTLRCWST